MFFCNIRLVQFRQRMVLLFYAEDDNVFLMAGMIGDRDERVALKGSARLIGLPRSLVGPHKAIQPREPQASQVLGDREERTQQVDKLLQPLIENART